ncbi:MAG: ABC transporter, partial [Rhodospirillales bacterium]
ISVDEVRTQPDPAALLANFKPSGTSLALAARSRGQSKSAFAEAPAVAEGQPARTAAHLAQSTGPINVIVVADTDMLEDRFWVQVQDFFGQRVATPAAYNGDFVVNAVDNLLG